MTTRYWDDTERDEATITKVDGGHDGWYSVTRDDGWSCFIDRTYGVKPKVGDRLVTWGGIGFPIRGQAINGRVLYYRTPAEQATENAKQAAERKAERKAKQIAEYEGKRSEYDARAIALPAPLRERIEGFRAFGGDEWRWSHEPYELMVCEEASRLAARFPTPDAIATFAKMGGYEAQKAAYPEMDSGHSGNSWGASVYLARLTVERPDLVRMAHGALCPLVGCTDCGCYAARPASPPSDTERGGA